MSIRLSILICTLESRKESFERVKGKLLRQIEKNGLTGKVEVLFLSGEGSTGDKRNQLLEAASGDYVQFLDDDDDVHEFYVLWTYNALKDDPDCVSLTGIMTTDGRNPKKFIHSIKWFDYFEKEGVYYRPPNHLNAIRADIAKQFKFPSKTFGEDTDWAMQIARSKLLKTEVEITEPVYFYLYQPGK